MDAISWQLLIEARMDDPLDFGHRYRLRGGGWPADCPGTDAAPAGDRPAAGGLYQSGPRDAAGDAGAISVPFPAHDGH